VTVRYERTRFQLIQEGFDPEVVNKISSGDRMHFDSEDRARGSIDDTYDFRQNEGKDERTVVSVYECYMWIDMITSKDDGDAVSAQLWHIITGGTSLLFKEVVDEIPMHFWSPIMISHKAIGLSMADVTMDLQNATSNTVRGMIDNVHRVNAGVRMADLSLLDNPRQFIDNPIGGVVDATAAAQRTMSVAPQAALAPVTGTLLQILGAEKEKRTGDTQLGKGLQSQDVVTHQNSADMIQTLINAGNERIMMMAQSFSEVLKALFLDIYRIGYENGQTTMIAVDGQYREFDPRSIPYSENMKIDVALTPEYGEARAGQLMQLNGMAQNDEKLAPLYGMEERYALFSEVSDLLGQPNYLADPKQPKVQQRLQKEQQQKQQMQKMQMDMAKMQSQLQQQSLQIQAQKVQGDLKLKKEKLDLDSAIGSDKQMLDEDQFKWDKKIDLLEYQLERTQDRAVSVG